MHGLAPASVPFLRSHHRGPLSPHGEVCHILVLPEADEQVGQILEFGIKKPTCSKIEAMLCKVALIIMRAIYWPPSANSFVLFLTGLKTEWGKGVLFTGSLRNSQRLLFHQPLLLRSQNALWLYPFVLVCISLF